MQSNNCLQSILLLILIADVLLKDNICFIVTSSRTTSNDDSEHFISQISNK